MGIPPDHILRAATLWMKLLPDTGITRLRALFATAEDYSDLTPTQYEEGLAWLRQTGLLNQLNEPGTIPERLFHAALTNESPLWFRDTDLLVRSPVELPEDALSAAKALGLSHDVAFSRTVAAWGKVDTTERTRIGSAGELALLQLLREAVPHLTIDHVAANFDGLGYDISVTGAIQAHLEVKSTTRKERVTFYLSRNEYQVAVRDPQWHLVLVRLNPDLELVAVATVPTDWITDHVPRDRTIQGRWESCRLDVPPDIPVIGIPTIAQVSTTQAMHVCDLS